MYQKNEHPAALPSSPTGPEARPTAPQAGRRVRKCVQLRCRLADGKSLYKSFDKAKLKDYTLRKVLQQVRKEQGGTPPDAAKQGA